MSNWIEAYCNNQGISRELAKAQVDTPLFKLLSDYLDKSKQVGDESLLSTYDPNIVQTLRGELRTIFALKVTLHNLKEFSEGKNSAPIEGPEESLEDPLFEAVKAPIKLK